MPEARRIAVVRFRDEYRIVSPSGAWGRFKFRVDAEEAALRLSARALTQGYHIDVLVQDSFGVLSPLKASP